MYRRFQKRPYDTTPLAVILDFEIGARVGELVALKSTDIKGSEIHIQRQEVKRYVRNHEGKLKFSHYEVVDYTKIKESDRYVYLTKKALEIINLITETNNKYGNYCEDYLFCRDKSRISKRGVQSRIHDGCKKIGIPVKSAHKIRKTYVSTLVDSQLNIDEVRRQAGHADEKTTYRNYCFNRKTSKETGNIIEDALSKFNDARGYIKVN
ncbi:MAG: tyrosine-type recombinase/integrase [Eubacteriales bacterium]